MRRSRLCRARPAVESLGVQAVRDPIRVAALGLWHVHARDYCAAAMSHPGTELVAVWDDDDMRGRAGAADFDVRFEAEINRVLDSDVDGVIVTAPTSRHRDVALAAAAARKHIFTEKLLAPTVDEAVEIVDAVDAHGVCLVVSLPRLYAGYTSTVREVIDDGSLGELSYARVRLSHAGAIDRPGGPWLPDRFFDPAEAVGGALTDLGCHPAYLIQLFLGSMPETVSATYKSLTGRAVEDHAVVTLGYADQRIGVVEAGFVSDDKFSIEIAGSDGWLRYRPSDGGDPAHAPVYAGGPAFGPSPQALPLQPDAPSPFEQWVEHIVGGSRADDNIARAVELTRLVVAANEAAVSGSTVFYAG
jgi:predicted dehydrogenase